MLQCLFLQLTSANLSVTLSNLFFFPYSWCVDPPLIKEYFSLEILILEGFFHMNNSLNK